MVADGPLLRAAGCQAPAMDAGPTEHDAVAGPPSPLDRAPDDDGGPPFSVPPAADQRATNDELLVNEATMTLLPYRVSQGDELAMRSPFTTSSCPATGNAQATATVLWGTSSVTRRCSTWNGSVKSR